MITPTKYPNFLRFSQVDVRYSRKGEENERAMMVPCPQQSFIPETTWRISSNLVLEIPRAAVRL
jgi:hypothetical protein